MFRIDLLQRPTVDSQSGEVKIEPATKKISVAFANRHFSAGGPVDGSETDTALHQLHGLSAMLRSKQNVTRRARIENNGVCLCE